MIIANDGNNYFLIASINFKTKIIYSILNILPQEEIKELKYNNKIINYVRKNNGMIYFSVIEDYLLIAGDSNTIQSMIDSYLSKEKIYKNDLYNLCTSNEVFIYYKLDKDYNKYKLLPEINDISLKFNVKDFNAKLYAAPSGNSYYNRSTVLNDVNVLKYFSKDFGLNYFNGFISVRDIVNPLVENYRVDADNKNQVLKKENAEADLNVFNDFYDGGYFGLNNFKLVSGSKDIAPEICSVFKLKDDISSGRIDEITKKILNIYSFLFKIDGWDKENVSYEKYKAKGTDFSIIRYQKYYFFIFGSDFSNDIVKKNLKFPNVVLR